MTLMGTLHQEEKWGREDESVAIKEMDSRHIKNVLSWIWRNREDLKLGAEAEMAFGYKPTAEAASDAFEQAFDMLLNEPVQTWVRELPLVVAMCAELKSRGEGAAWMEKRGL